MKYLSMNYKVKLYNHSNQTEDILGWTPISTRPNVIQFSKVFNGELLICQLFNRTWRDIGTNSTIKSYSLFNSRDLDDTIEIDPPLPLTLNNVTQILQDILDNMFISLL